MKRTKLNDAKKEGRPTAIITGDWHLRDDIPICRTDNFWAAQWEKVIFIQKLSHEYDCPIIFSGDLFNHWKPSPHLLSETLRHLPKIRDIVHPAFITVYGNHDLPQWNIDLSYKCGVKTLETAGSIQILPECHWGMTPSDKFIFSFTDLYTETQINGNILLWHVMTFLKGNPPWPGCEDVSAEEILNKYPQFDLVVTGHHHRTFSVEKDGRLLVNPGSLTRQTADQIDHKPCVFLWYAEDNTVEQIIIPHEKNVISREHINRQHARDERIDHFISQLSAEYTVGLSFEENLERFEKKNNVRQSVMEIIRKAIE